MKKKKDIETLEKIKRSIIIQTLFIVSSSFSSVLFVKLAENNFKMNLDVLMFAGGIIIPLSIILGISNYFISNYMYRQFSDLAYGLEKACDGDYYAKLDPTKAGAMGKVFINFNKITDELKNVRNMHDDFVNTYSHEFKTPITSIKGFAELLTEDNISDEDRKKYAEIILKESVRLSNLTINSILMTKLNTKEIVDNKVEFSLDEQIRKIVILLEPEWKEKNINIECNLEKVIYYSNPEMLEQLWINLISNAIKYNKKNGSIDIKLRKRKYDIEIIISDTGIGIEETKLKYIFDKYYQEDKSKTVSGLGLGLSIVQRILELVKGRIEVESIKGTGSLFKVYI